MFKIHLVKIQSTLINNITVKQKQKVVDFNFLSRFPRIWYVQVGYHIGIIWAFALMPLLIYLIALVETSSLLSSYQKSSCYCTSFTFCQQMIISLHKKLKWNLLVPLTRIGLFLFSQCATIITVRSQNVCV